MGGDCAESFSEFKVREQKERLCVCGRVQARIRELKSPIFPTKSPQDPPWWRMRTRKSVEYDVSLTCDAHTQQQRLQLVLMS